MIDSGYNAGDIYSDFPGAREYDLLARLVEAGGKVVTHRQLLTAVWGPANAQDVQYLRVFIGHLRQKLEDDSAQPRRIVTESGVGYRFIANEA